MGMNFHRAAPTALMRAGRPAGLDIARVMYPDGGGLEFCWLLRRALEPIGVELIDRLFITGLLAFRRHDCRRRRHRQPDRPIPRHQGAHDDRLHQRDHVPLRLRARHHRHRHAVGLSRRRDAAQRRIQLCAAGHAEVLFRGHYVCDPGRRAVGQRGRHAVHEGLRARLGGSRPTCRASRAPWRPKRKRATTRCISTCRGYRKHMRECSSTAK